MTPDKALDLAELLEWLAGDIHSREYPVDQVGDELKRLAGRLRRGDPPIPGRPTGPARAT